MNKKDRAALDFATEATLETYAGLIDWLEDEIKERYAAMYRSNSDDPDAYWYHRGFTGALEMVQHNLQLRHKLMQK